MPRTAAVREYSGMRQRPALLQALLGRPSVLFLDDPPLGLDPRPFRAFYATLRGFARAGRHHDP